MSEIPLIEISSSQPFNVFFSMVNYFGGAAFFAMCLCKIIDRS